MKLKLTLFAFILSCSVQAQYSNMLKGKVSCLRFLKSQTYFVLTGNDPVDKQLKEGVEEYWKLTEYQFISSDEVASIIRDTNKSFVYLKEFRIKGKNNLTGALALFNGGFDDQELYLSSSLAFISYDNSGVEKKQENIAYKVHAMVKQLNDLVQTVNNENQEFKSEAQAYAASNKIYNEQSGLLKNKTLLIDHNYLLYKIPSFDDFKKAYTYNIEVVTNEVIQDAIKTNKANTAVLYSSYCYYKVNTIIDCETLDIIYSEFKDVDPLYETAYDQFEFIDAQNLQTAVKKSKLEKL